MRRFFIAGNWKMNLSLTEAESLAQQMATMTDVFDVCDVAFYPNVGYLKPLSDLTIGSSLRWGGQNLYFEKSGAFTGETSASMLAELGATHVLCGHSERRHLFLETAEIVGKKVKAALQAKLKPTLCVGETLAERELNHTAEVVLGQLAAGLSTVNTDEMDDVTIAYEPVWAIGTGKTASPEQAQAVHQMIRKALRSRFNDEIAERCCIQYGGSVKPQNATELLAQPDIDGALVGGASLKFESFIAIIEAAKHLAY